MIMNISEIYKIFKSCSGVTTDSRTLKGGELFFALKGENFDGNEYALKALEAYANASAFTAENYDAAKKQIQDARKAYEDLVRSDKKFLEDNGFLAYLTAAEKAMPAEKPAAPTTGDDTTTDDGKQGGCQSSLTIGAVATMILAGAWVTIAARKKED